MCDVRFVMVLILGDNLGLNSLLGYYLGTALFIVWLTPCVDDTLLVADPFPEGLIPARRRKTALFIVHMYISPLDSH